MRIPLLLLVSATTTACTVDRNLGPPDEPSTENLAPYVPNGDTDWNASTLLASFPIGGSIRQLDVDDDAIYPNYDGKIVRVDRATGAQTTLDYADYSYTDNIVDVYFVDDAVIYRAADGIYERSRDGATVRTLASGSFTTLAVSGDTIVAGTARVPLDSGALPARLELLDRTTLATTLLAEGCDAQCNFFHAFVDDGFVYFEQMDGITNGSGGYSRIPLVGGVVAPHVGPSWPLGFTFAAVADHSLFQIGGNEITKLSLDNSDAEILAVAGSGGFGSSIHVLGGYVYWTTYSADAGSAENDSGAVKCVPIGGGAVTTVLHGAGLARQLGASTDGSQLVVAVSNDLPGAEAYEIYAVPPCSL